MEEAIVEALKALDKGEVPIGCVVVDPGGKIVGRGHNSPITDRDPTAHAELEALREASKKTGNYRLPGHALYVTIEPCPMCAGAIVHARISRVIFGAKDEKGGGMLSVYKIGTDGNLNHRVEVKYGVLEDRCRSMIQDFFREKRKR